MNDLENGMVLGADREWERMNEDTPYDVADTSDIDRYACDTERVHEVVELICGLEDGDLNEEVAVCIVDHLSDAEYTHGLLEWFGYESPDKYNEWYREHNSWEEN